MITRPSDSAVNHKIKRNKQNMTCPSSLESRTWAQRPEALKIISWKSNTVLVEKICTKFHLWWNLLKTKKYLAYFIQGCEFMKFISIAKKSLNNKSNNDIKTAIKLITNKCNVRVA